MHNTDCLIFVFLSGLPFFFLLFKAVFLAALDIAIDAYEFVDIFMITREI